LQGIEILQMISGNF